MLNKKCRHCHLSICPDDPSVYTAVDFTDEKPTTFHPYCNEECHQDYLSSGRIRYFFFHSVRVLRKLQLPK